MTYKKVGAPVSHIQVANKENIRQIDWICWKDTENENDRVHIDAESTGEASR